MKVLLTVVLNDDGEMVAEGDPLTGMESAAVAITLSRYFADLLDNMFDPILNPVVESVREAGRVLVPCIICHGSGATPNARNCPNCDGKGFV